MRSSSDRRIRSLPWQRLVVKLEEDLPHDDQVFPAFREVTFSSLKDILEHLGLKARLGEVLGYTQTKE